MENRAGLEPTGAERRKAFDQVLAVLKMNGVAIDEKTLAYLQPLLDGSMTPLEHQAMLEALIRELEHG